MTAAFAADDGPALRDQVAEEVRVWLARRRISGAELARRLGRSQTFVAKRIDGRQAFDVDDLEQVARILNVPVTVFFGGPMDGSDDRTEDPEAADAQVITLYPAALRSVATNSIPPRGPVGVTRWTTPIQPSGQTEIA